MAENPISKKALKLLIKRQQQQKKNKKKKAFKLLLSVLVWAKFLILSYCCQC